ncbi:dehydrogenase (plasmid) [Frondihabitans sp. PAMC 28766]|uniref:phytoene desaturase family protein n=1 Tax=Frondihabitans sp. PAMC 28766 TaxID=1795630 RepID=UPI00078BDC3C|nr:NAD(P)/FAD-dependent oxidoreductase [Frondihabitans sp. PAMC 28766]AMM22648.1 dehydrogenase [Frondihabitans sp. PAMC 28766]
MHQPDVVVVGSGPNGLAAAVTMARAGLAVQVFEAKPTAGGGARTSELTLPGFLHDNCSAVHPMAVASAFFRQFRLAERIPLVTPDISYAHPLDHRQAGIAYRDLERTVDGLGQDGVTWRRLFGPLVEHADQVARLAGSSLLRAPRHPGTALQFACRTFQQGTRLWSTGFKEDVAPAMLTGVMAHAILPLPALAAAAAGLSLGTYAHARGWPVPVGGSQAITHALIDDLEQHGGEVITDHQVDDIGSLDGARAVVFDVSPRELLRISGRRFPDLYRRRLERFRYGSGTAKVDFALNVPVPWAVAELTKAGTVHVGGSRTDIARAEREVAHGQHAAAPYVLAAQPTPLDPSRTPAGGHVLWTYAHVPTGSNVDQTETIIRQIERFAPGFRDTILATHQRTAAGTEQYDANYVGGDIAAGRAGLHQLLARPILSTDPWRVPVDGMYLCSSSTPPGPGVHGLAGWYAARSALRHTFGIATMPSLAPD